MWGLAIVALYTKLIGGRGPGTKCHPSQCVVGLAGGCGVSFTYPPDMQCNCAVGLMPLISRAWLTVDSTIYIWSYEDG